MRTLRKQWAKFAGLAGLAVAAVVTVYACVWPRAKNCAGFGDRPDRNEYNQRDRFESGYERGLPYLLP